MRSGGAGFAPPKQFAATSLPQNVDNDGLMNRSHVDSINLPTARQEYVSAVHIPHRQVSDGQAVFQNNLPQCVLAVQFSHRRNSFWPLHYRKTWTTMDLLHRPHAA